MKTAGILAAFAFSVLACRTAEAQYFPPSESQGGWRPLVRANTTPSASEKMMIRSTVGLDWDKLRDAWNYTQGFNSANSVLVIRNGWIAAEWNTFTSARGIASCTKSLTSIAMARLFDMSAAGQTSKAIGPEDFAYRYLPSSWGNADPARRQIRLRHLLTMSSGVEPYDGPYDSTYQSVILSLPVEDPPEQTWAYSSATVDLMSLIVEDVTGKKLRNFFNDEIARPIGVPNLSSSWTEFNGHTHGALGARITARDLARVGYLLLHGGDWNGRRVVSSNRVSTITQWASFLRNAAFRNPQPPAGGGNNAPFVSDRNSPRYYGWLFWTNRTGDALGSGVPSDASFLYGWGKQACFVVPSLDMVVVRLGSKASLNSIQDYWPQFWSRIMSAVVPASSLPAVSMTATDANASEAGPDNGRFTVSRSGSTGGALTVRFSIGGSATNGSDYASLGSSVTISSGSSSATVTVRPTDDSNVEGNETVTLTLSNDSAYSIGSPSSATVTISDNDSPPPSQSVIGLMLMNADTDQPVGPLQDGDTVDLTALPTRNLNVRADTSPATVGSVRFALDSNSNFRTESSLPYALAGDTGGDYWNWTPAAGSHTLTATPYTGSGASGTAGNAITVSFTVVDNAPPPPPGGGTGLTGEFYDGIDFSTFLFTRTDASIDFDWGAGAPDPSTGADAFSIRWSGLLDPQHSETYTFTTNSDDGVRLWVDGRLLVDNWTDHGATLDSGTLALTAGQQVPLVLEYYENGGDAVIQLLWSSASQAQQIIPSTQLLIQDTDGDGMADTAEMLAGLDLLDSDQDGNGILDGQDDWDGDGTDNQTELATGSNPGSPPGGTTTSSSGGGGCGATGLEVLLLLGLLRGRRRSRLMER